MAKPQPFLPARSDRVKSEHVSAAFIDIADLEEFTAKLDLVATWRDELHRKIARATLSFELCGLDAEEQEQLTQEVFAFTSLCRALTDTL
jgi:hypothetical protein